MARKLRILLYIIAMYLGVFGSLFLFAPSVAQEFTKTTYDPVLSLLYGQYTLTFAFLALLAARENRVQSNLSLIILILSAGHVIIFGYLLALGLQAFAQAGPPLIVNTILTVLLFLFRKKADRI